MTKKVGIILGSTRQGRISPSIAEWVASTIAKHPELTAEMLDLEAINLPFFNEPTIPSVAPGVSEAATAWREKVTSLDAFIILTAEYNAGYPAPLKNALDYLKTEWANRPILVVSYGFGGGASAAHQLSEVLTRIGTVQIEPNITILIGDKLNANGGIDDPHTSFAIHDEELDVALKAIEAWTPAEE
ncbi:MAG TPA: NAD(P)H-dependent oxidoreductase [Candidatus Saccharimonadales bacterium]